MQTVGRVRGHPLYLLTLLSSSACSIYDASLLAGATGPESGAGGSSGDNDLGAGGTASGGGPSSGGAGAQIPMGGAPATGGAKATGGGPGSGGTPAAVCSEVDASALLSDFEAGTAIVHPVDGRSGNWFLFNDGSGAQTPEKPSTGPMLATEGGTCETVYALRTTGTGFSGWGAGIGFDLVPKKNGEKQPHDLSGYSGFAFFVRSSESLQLRVSWSDANTTEEGGVCDAEAQSGDPDRCGDYFGVDLILTTEWTRHDILFSEMTQRGFGLTVPDGFDAATAYSFRAQTTSGDFEIWLDEVVLLP